ncbi:probable bifunctional dTTP/UTP pyrophosphatase/methyltransferase protein isoform X2 [Conger conger]|uniref:probable bifunctional dTTP/UTP pyrophosphatase/methyltransferase protein isoform X2 n=1 Tax=Conger conger TaxID=82655 RepID=UPI002A5AD2C7|nr:probable bifunctional dTTP/UTP pyrophosphatase/methyltransferase protein isoform X2 [Conger conger]
MVLNPVVSKLTGKLVVLASASPRRREILTNLGLKFEVVPSWFKETLDKSLFKQPHEYAVETARQKALEVAKRMPSTVDGLILEKPADKQDAYNMLSRLSGKEHSVFTGVVIVLCHQPEGREMEKRIFDFYEETKVKFADLSEEMVWEYVNSGEPMDKAGGYGIQALGGMLVESVQGDYLNVVGFPLNHFCKRLGQIYSAAAEHPGTAERQPHCEEPTLASAVPAPATGGAVHTPNLTEPRGGVPHSPNFPHKIVDIIDGFKASKCLFIASKLKLFDLLASEDGLSAEEVAGKMAATVRMAEKLLEALVSLELLNKSTRRGTTAYRNTEEGSRYLVSSAECSLHGYIMYCNEDVWPLCSRLELALLEGSPRPRDTPEPAFQEAYYSTQEGTLRFMSAMDSIAKVAGRDVATAFDLSRFKVACDLGGCTGAMARQLVEAHPGLSVTVFDLPAVVELSSHFCPAPQHTGPITFVAGDFFTDDLPKADLYILTKILHDFTDEKLNLLLSKLSRICSPGCGLLVSEMFLNEERSGPSRVLLLAAGSGMGRERSVSEYLQLLGQHGFSQPRVRRTGNLLDTLLCIKQ